MKSIAKYGRFILVLTGLCWSVSVAAEKVVVGVPNWAYAKVIANVIKVVVEENYGVDVEFVPGTHPVFFKAMSDGRGEVDIHPDVWMPVQNTYVKEYVEKEKTVVLTGPKFEARSGFCTFQSAEDQYGLASVYDLTRPEIVSLTDKDDDGRGEIWIGASGWSATPTNRVRARDYGFADLYELTSSEETVILSNVDAAAKSGNVVIWACYSPHHVFVMHELIMLDEPEHDPEKWNPVLPAEAADWYEKSYVETSWPPIFSHQAYSTRLLEDAPNVARFLNNIKFDTDLINEWSFVIAVENRDPYTYARDWVANNQERVNSWLKF